MQLAIHAGVSAHNKTYETMIRNYLFITSLLIVSCNNFSQYSNANKEENIDLNIKLSDSISSENFDSFYLKFCTDTLFQKSRIIFPLNGNYIHGCDTCFESIVEQWNTNNISQLNSKDFLIKQIDGLKYNITRNDSLCNEKFWIENSGFKIERKFIIVKNKWFLCYYELCNL